MSPTYIPPLPDRCDRCKKCVEISITSDPLGRDSESITSECKTDGCPLKTKYKPNSDQSVNIYFVDCD